MPYYSSLFTLTQPYPNLFNFVANIALSRIRIFWGHFWPEFGGGGHKNILVDQGITPRALTDKCNVLQYTRVGQSVESALIALAAIFFWLIARI